MCFSILRAIRDGSLGSFGRLAPLDLEFSEGVGYSDNIGSLDVGVSLGVGAKRPFEGGLLGV